MSEFDGDYTQVLVTGGCLVSMFITLLIIALWMLFHG